MARRERHKQGLTEGKRRIIAELLQEYDVKTADDIQEALRDLLGDTIHTMMEAEMTDHLGYNSYERKDNTNYRNGTKPKTVHSKYGDLDIDVPQDRNSTFNPQIVKKYQKDISAIDEKIISMYARGMTTRQISDEINSIYGFECSESFISDVTDKIMPEIEEWQNRPLEAVYPVVYIDAVHFSVREDGIVSKRAAYVILGIRKDGKKEVISLEIGENETSKYWLSVLNNLKNRGVSDIFLICADGLTGFREAIEASFPNTEYQRCMVHQVRNSLKYVASKDMKDVAKDLKTIYLAPNEETGYKNLQNVKTKWQTKYPLAIKSWENNWDVIQPMFKFSENIRRIIYTTNAIESLNSTYKRLNRQRSVFPSSRALLKALYLGTKEASKKWTMPLRDWRLLMNEFIVMYGDRMPI